MILYCLLGGRLLLHTASDPFSKYPDFMICFSAGRVCTFPLVVLITPGFILEASTK